MQIVDSFEYLTDCLGRILLREFSLLADTIEQLATGRQLSHNVIFVLGG